MFNWKKREESEVTPGGATVLRYDAATWSSGLTGDTARLPAFADSRHVVYEKLFGAVDQVFDEAGPLVPRIQLRSYYRRGPGGQRVCALVTSGMSDLPMNLPARAQAPRRVELILYCAEPKPEYVATLRWLAHFPHDQTTWIGTGHTIPNGNPPAPFWGSPILDTLLLLPPIVNRDATLPKELTHSDGPVSFLWVVPITSAECNLKLQKGLDALLGLFEKNRHPHVYDPTRSSYV